MNIVNKLAALFSAGALAVTAFAQSADPAITAATHVPQTIVVGQVSQLRTDFANAGFDPIPTSSIKLSICGADGYYQTNGVTPPSGYGTNFTWTHPSADCWEGINNVAIAAGAGGAITLGYTGLLVTPSPQTTVVNMEVIANLAAFTFDNTANNQLTATLAVVSPLLTKSFSSGSIADGGTTTLSFTLTASNTAAASSISFVDTLPTGLRVANPANVGGTCANSAAATSAPAGGSAITISNVNVPAGPSACTVTVQVTNVAGQNNASCAANPAAFTNGPGNISGLSLPAVNGVQPNCLGVDAPVAVITMLKTGPASIVAGASVPYSLTLTNTGGAAQPSGFVFYEVVPTNSTFTSVGNATSSCAVGAAAGTLCTLTTTAPVPAGGSLVVNYTVTVNASLPAGTTGLVNAIYTAPPAACVGSTCPAPVCPDAAAASCTTTPTAPVVGFVKSSAVTNIAPSAAVPFSLTLSNTGGAAQPSGYVFYEVVPANTTFASVANATSSCAVGSVAGTLCTLATTSPVPAGGSLVVTYTVTVNASIPAGTTTVANAIYSSPPTGCSGSACPTPVCPDTAAAACVVAPSAPIISFAKSSAATSIAAGASVPYSLTLINTGGAPQPSGYVFYEVVPSNTTFTSVANATSSCAVGSPAGTLCALTTIAPIAAGSSLVVTYTVTVNASIPAGATTIANAIYTTVPSGCTGSACPAPVCPNPAAAACFVVPFGSVIGLAKSSGVTHFAAGVVLPYSLTLSNTGSAAQSSGYVFYEVVPGNTTFTSVANATSSCAVGSAAGTLCALTTTAPIAAGSSLVVTYTVTVNARIPLGTTSAANAIYRTPPSGCVGSTCPVPACPDANAAACNITLSDAVIGFTKSSGLTSIAPGAVVPYSLTLTNSGGMAQPGGFVFYEVVPVDTKFTSVANATSSCAVGAAAGTLCALTTISSVPVGSSMVVTYTVTANASFSAGATSMVNAIYATPPSGCTGSACPAPVCPDAAAVACNITPTSPSTPPIPSRLASMVLTKSASAPTVMQGADRAIPDAGDTITYAFSVTNTGNVAFDSVSVFDAKLPTLNCVAQSAQVLPGATAALLCTNNVYSLTSADAAAGRVLNSATASGVPSTCTPAVVPCPSTLTPPSAIATPLATPIVDSTQMIPSTSTWALLLLSLMLMASAGLVARSKR